jgi:hypothetical protein
MIGGTDIVIPTKGGQAALDACVRVIRRYWPHAVFEDAFTGERFEHYESLPIGRLKEVLAYQSGAIALQWDEKGADPTLCNTMIHLLLADGSVTAVMDNTTDAAMRRFIGSLQSALKADILNLLAEKPQRSAA